MDELIEKIHLFKFLNTSVGGGRGGVFIDFVGRVLALVPQLFQQFSSEFNENSDS